MYNALPEGKEKVNMDFGVKRLDTRKAQLEKSIVACNVCSQFGKQVDVNLLADDRRLHYRRAKHTRN